MNLLLDELARTYRAGQRPEAQAVLAPLGPIPWSPLWGIDTVVTDGVLYEPAADGRPAIIAAVLEADGLVDLVAVSPATRAMRRRCGLAPLLGRTDLEIACAHGRPLRLHADALSWLAADSVGAVVLDWHDAPAELADAPALLCPGEAFALRLHRAFAASLCPAPPLFVQPPRSQETP